MDTSAHTCVFVCIVFCVYVCVCCASRYLCMRMYVEVHVGIDVSRCDWIHLHIYACMYVCTHADKWLLTDCSDDFAARSGRAYGTDSTRLRLSHTPCRRSHVVQVACRTPRASAGVTMALSHNIIVVRCRGKRAGYRAYVGGKYHSYHKTQVLAKAAIANAIDIAKKQSRQPRFLPRQKKTNGCL